MVVYVFLVAVVNLLAGYALAVYVARNQSGPAHGAAAFNAELSLWASCCDAFWSLMDRFRPMREELLPLEPMPAPTPAKVAEPPRPIYQPTNILNSIEPEPAPAEQKLDAAAIEESMHEFKAELERYHQELQSLDDRMRQCAEQPEESKFRECVHDFKHVNQTYLQKQSETVDAWQRQGGPGHDTQFEANLHQAMAQQAAQIELANAKVNQIDREDLQAGCETFLEATGDLMAAGTNVSESVDAMLREFSRGNAAPTALEPPKKSPKARQEPTSLNDVAELQAMITRWQEAPMGDLSLAIVDVDEFGKLNAQHGRTIGDRILQAVAEIITLNLNADDKASRMGTQFLIMRPGVGARDCSTMTERIRQQVEQTRFQRAATEIQATVSCGVAEANSDQNMDEIIARANDMLREARRYGGNRTFFQDGELSAPAVSPNMAVAGGVLEI